MTKLDFTGWNAHQGDVEFFSITEIPSNVKKIEKQFIAASEKSGSFHALFGKYDMYEGPETGTFCIDVKEECILNHSLQENIKNMSMDEVKVLPKKDHRHTVIPKGKYFVGIQQRFDPFLGMKINTKD